MSSIKHRRTRSVSSLDFNEAMLSFQTMFPSEDIRVIEAVLQSNDGSVDSAIDQLLSINSVTRQAILLNRDDSSLNVSVIDGPADRIINVLENNVLSSS